MILDITNPPTTGIVMNLYVFLRLIVDFLKEWKNYIPSGYLKSLSE
jgi:hypothetical protein